MLIGGSSPRVRGTAGQSGIDAAHHRFIPAGAGNGTPVSPLTKDRPVHPRGCGERAKRSHADAVNVGSSPRVRGTVHLPVEAPFEERFIPAGAGNGLRTIPTAASAAVHPRGCGERAGPPGRARPDRGSSPRVRGTAPAPALRAFWARFIPAGAGNGPRRRPGGRRSTVHPRGCGERARLGNGGFDLAGSSPRVRGTAVLASSPAKFTAVHPRGCGERLVQGLGFHYLGGSSPRVRGTGGAVEGEPP